MRLVVVVVRDLVTARVAEVLGAESGRGTETLAVAGSWRQSGGMPADLLDRVMTRLAAPETAATPRLREVVLAGINDADAAAVIAATGVRLRCHPGHVVVDDGPGTGAAAAGFADAPQRPVSLLEQFGGHDRDQIPVLDRLIIANDLGGMAGLISALEAMVCRKAAASAATCEALSQLVGVDISPCDRVDWGAVSRRLPAEAWNLPCPDAAAPPTDGAAQERGGEARPPTVLAGEVLMRIMLRIRAWDAVIAQEMRDHHERRGMAPVNAGAILSRICRAPAAKVDAWLRRVDRVAREPLRLRAFTPGADRVSGGERLILAEMPETDRDIAAEAILLGMWQTGGGRPDAETDLLILVTRRPETGDAADEAPAPRTIALEHYGARRNAGLMRDWFRPDLRAAWGTGRLHYYGGGGECLFFGAEDRTGTDAAALDALADRILANLLNGNRPVAGWRLSFSQILGLKRELTADDIQALCAATRDPNRPVHLQQATHEERIYLADQVRDIFAPAISAGQTGPADGCTALADALNHGHALISLMIDVGAGGRLNGQPTGPLSLRYVHNSRASARCAPVVGLRLHLAFRSVLILEVILGDRLNPDPSGEEHLSLAAQMQPWKAANEDVPQGWRALLTPPAGPVFTVADALDWAALGRFTHSGFAEAGLPDDPTPGHVAISLHGPSGMLGHMIRGHAVTPDDQRLTGWFGALIDIAFAALGWDRARLAPRLLTDDRAHVVHSLVTLGQMPDQAEAVERRLWLRGRLATVDRYYSGPAYDPGATRAEIAAAAYGRFDADGSWFAATSHSFVMWGSGWFARNVIHAVQMPTMYRRLFLITQIQAGVLMQFTAEVIRRLPQLVEGDADPVNDQRAQFRDLRRRLIRFNDGLWYGDVTTQVQGRELFELMRRQARLDAEYRLIDDKITRTESWLASLTEEAAAMIERRGARVQAVLFGLGLPVVIAIGLLGLKEFVAGSDAKGEAPIWDLLSGASAIAHLPVWAVAYIIGCGVSALLYRRELFGHPHPAEPTSAARPSWMVRHLDAACRRLPEGGLRRWLHRRIACYTAYVHPGRDPDRAALRNIGLGHVLVVLVSLATGFCTYTPPAAQKPPSEGRIPGGYGYPVEIQYKNRSASEGIMRPYEISMKPTENGVFRGHLTMGWKEGSLKP